MMAEWFLYIIQCKNGSLYTGITLDVTRRFSEHTSQGGKCAKYLKGKAPLTLVFSERVGEKGRAYRVEKRVKSLSQKRKMDLIHGKITIQNL